MGMSNGSNTDDGRGSMSADENVHALGDDPLRPGGAFGLIRELARISSQLDASVLADWMIRRVQFFAYELQTLISEDASERDRLATLNRFFFENKKFLCFTDSARLPDPSSVYVLNKVLSARCGAPTVVALLYACLAERIGLCLEFVDLKPTCFLKWSDQGRSRYIDVTRGGVTLSNDELIEMLQSRFQMTTLSVDSLLETYSFETLLAEYVTELKIALLPANDAEKLLFLQNTLISYQPSNMQLFGERALLHRRLGNFKSSLADLKRYFTFHDRDKAPADLVRMHDELVQLLDRSKTNIEVID